MVRVLGFKKIILLVITFALFLLVGTTFFLNPGPNSITAAAVGVESQAFTGKALANDITQAFYNFTWLWVAIISLGIVIAVVVFIVHWKKQKDNVEYVSDKSTPKKTHPKKLLSVRRPAKKILEEVHWLEKHWGKFFLLPLLVVIGLLLFTLFFYVEGIQKIGIWLIPIGIAVVGLITTLVFVYHHKKK